jgi:large subunit ribosomal protein L18
MKKVISRQKRHIRIRRKLKGNAQRPRLSVYRSLKHIHAQVIDDIKAHTLVSASTLDREFKEKYGRTGNVQAANILGEILAKKALNKGVKKVVFDRGGFAYHGRVKALAESARKAGLEF